MYKPGQGYWTRLMTAIGAGTVVLMGAVWIGDLLRNTRIGNIEPIITAASVGFLLCVIMAFVIYRFVGKNEKSVDFLIATEGEMKKVNWSSKREVFGSTWVVIGLCFFVTIFVYLFDLGFAALFSAMRVLDAS